MVIEEKGIWEQNLAISISKYSKYFKGNDIILANVIDTKEIRYKIQPKIIMIPKSGPAKRLEIQKVKDIVLNWKAIIGIIAKFAEIVTESISIIFGNIFTIFPFIHLEILFWNKTIPIVPPYDNWKPIFKIK